MIFFCVLTLLDMTSRSVSCGPHWTYLLTDRLTAKTSTRTGFKDQRISMEWLHDDSLVTPPPEPAAPEEHHMLLLCCSLLRTRSVTFLLGGIVSSREKPLFGLVILGHGARLGGNDWRAANSVWHPCSIPRTEVTRFFFALLGSE